ncbi:MAG TPA: glycogen debranching N-terminal domain-containing protein [Polyangiaceae bacterium]|nr:glycogen debranching N-terminal domain-containing protein [Polyangiaceae bacterium]
MSAQSIAILEGNTFVVSDRRGDIEGSPTDTQGLFADDTRFISRWVLTIDGTRPSVLSTDDVEYFEAQFFLAPTSGTIYVDADVSIMRKRTITHGFREEIVVTNHSAKTKEMQLRLEVAADFADLFEVKDALKKKGEYDRRAEADRLVLGYRRDSYARETHVVAPGAAIDEGGLRYAVQLGPHATWSTAIDVNVVSVADVAIPDYRERGDGSRVRQLRVEHALSMAPQVKSDWLSLVQTYQRSVIDTAALRYYPPLLTEGSMPAAGLPWFMAVFGRDSIIMSIQALPFVPVLAATTLRVLGARQGQRMDAFRDEEPGKILHESRAGEMTAFAERPHSPYFGSADSTPLFLVLLDEYERWTGDADLVRALEPSARAALRWMDEYGDRLGNGYISYKRRDEETGLENQCWKDSWNSIIFRDGSLSKLPRACCEIQGYAYDAKVRAARLARAFWNDGALAARLEREAAELKARFNRDFWMEDRQCYALAIDGDLRVVDSITSNIGHLLWSGIVDDDKAPHVVRHLMSDRLFTGWGVRTMADSEGGYNPIGYHVGTVWPHDNSIIALGLNRYGYRDESARIAAGILQAAHYFRNRLPEAFAGYPRSQTHFPVEYPTACSPQAWATGSPLMLLRTLLGLEPKGNRLTVDAALPPEIEWIEIRGLPGRWGKADVVGRRPTAPAPAAHSSAT